MKHTKTAVLCLILSLSLYAEHGKKDERAVTTENCGEVVGLACAFMNGCRVGLKSCNYLTSSVCWDEFQKQILSLTTANCSKWIHVAFKIDEPIECYLGEPRPTKHGAAPKSFILDDLRSQAATHSKAR